MSKGYWIFLSMDIFSSIFYHINLTLHFYQSLSIYNTKLYQLSNLFCMLFKLNSIFHLTLQIPRKERRLLVSSFVDNRSICAPNLQALRSIWTNLTEHCHVRSMHLFHSVAYLICNFVLKFRFNSDHRKRCDLILRWI